MKKLLFLLISVFLLASCYPCKRLARKCPPQIIRERYDSIIVRDSLIYKDRTVEVKIPGDTVTVEKFVPVKEDISPIRVENDYALAKAWVENSKLKLQLILKDQVIKFRIDSAIQVAKHWEYRWRNEEQIETTTIREKYIPKIYKIALFASICGVILLGIYIYIKIKAKGLKV